jgi:selenoprotein W-related protein
LAARLLSQYKQRISSLELQPSGGGCFEVTIGNELIYSKLATGEFPDEQKILAEVGRRL